MRARTRATNADDKAERRDAILDAAERLMRTAPERVGMVRELAAEADVAKGTVYLYFDSKEAIFLALHERHVEVFFTALIARLTAPDPITLDEVLSITNTHIVHHETYMPCASVCFGAMERSMSADAIACHHQRIGGWITTAADGLERHFPALPTGGGVGLLRQSYALMIGLWQLLKPEAQARVAAEASVASVFRAEYAQEVETALRALWAGTLSATSHRA